MKILITGGAGYLGSVMTKNLLDLGHEITVLDSLLFKQISPLTYTNNKKYNFIYGDVRNKELLTKLVKSHDVIIPLAAIVGFPACKSDPKSAWDINHNQIIDIVEIISKDQLILYPNTNSGYGVGYNIGENQSECTEESSLKPISVYGESKCASEKLLLDSTSSVCFRLATVFGSSPRMRTDLLVNEFVYKAMTDKYIVVFEKHFKRNFIHIQDVANVFTHALNNYDSMKGNVYNVGLSDANLNKEELLEKIKLYVPDFAITYSDFYEDPDKRDYIVSNKKIESTGWLPNYTLDDGIQELIKSYQVLIPRMTSEFRNGFPLGYANNT
jgi:nucleoside-diphosphate-sugar epimerase